MGESCFRELIVSPLDHFDEGKEINLSTVGSNNAQYVLPGDASAGLSFGSAYAYKLSQNAPQNRFIQWRVNGSALHLQEVSLDVGLRGSALRLILPHQIIPNVVFQEVTESMHTHEPRLSIVAVTIERTLFRFIFPYPSMTPEKDPSGTYSVPSIFAGASLTSLTFEAMPSICKPEITHVAAVDAVTVALGTRMGSICLVPLRPITDVVSGVAEPPTDVVELKDQSVLKTLFNRVWSSSSNNDIMGMACLPRRGDTIIFSLSEDDKIRVWSQRERKMLLSVPLPGENWDDRVKSQHNGKSAGRTLRFWANSAHNAFRVVVYSLVGEESQFALFEGEALGEDWESGDVTLRLAGVSFIVSLSLIDFQVSSDSMWTLWKGEDEGFSVKQLPLAANKGGFELSAWNDVVMEDIDEDIDFLHEFDPSIENYPELFLSALFEPGRFSARALQRGLQTYLGASTFSHNQITLAQDLRVTFAESVARVFHESQSASLGNYGVYFQWRRLLTHCSDAWLAENEPCGIFVQPDGVVTMTNRASSSILLPCDPIDALYCRSHMLYPEVGDDEHSQNRQPQRTRSSSSDVEQLLATMNFVAAQLSPGALRSYRDAVRDYDDPISAANTILVHHLVSVLSSPQALADADLMYDHNEPRSVRTSWRAQQLASLRARLDKNLEHARRSRHLFFDRLLKRFRGIKNPVDAILQLISPLYRKQDDESMQVDGAPVGSAQDILRRIVSGDTVENIVQRGARLLAQSRFALLRNLSVLLLLVARAHPKAGLTSDQTEVLSSEVFPSLNRLGREFAVVYFLTRELSIVEGRSTDEQLADPMESMDFSRLTLESFPAAQIQDSSDPALVLKKSVPLMRLFFRSLRISVPRVAHLVTSLPVPPLVSDAHSSVLLQCVLSFVALLTPSAAVALPYDLNVLSCLEKQKQFSALRDFILLLNEPSAAIKHLLGMSHVGLDQHEEALECFMQAGVALATLSSHSADNSLLLELIKPSGVVDHSGDLQLAYYRYLIKEFEDRKHPDLAVHIALSAISHMQSQLLWLTDLDAKNSTEAAISSLWISVFSQSLQIGDFEQAYLATINISNNIEDRRDCLRQLLVVMAEKGHILQLVAEFPYVGLLDEVHEILLQRARRNAVNEAPNYYHILYSLHVHRGNYRRAAQLSFECAERILNEAHTDDPHGLQFVYSYSTMLLSSLYALRMVDPQYAWVTALSATSAHWKKHQRNLPTGVMRASPKRKADIDSSDANVQEQAVAEVLVFQITDLEHMLLNSQHVSKLILRGTDYPIATMLRSPESTLRQLITNQIFDDAVTLAHRLELDMAPIFEGITRVILTSPDASPTTLKQQWIKLQQLLDRFDTVSLNHKYSLVVVATILRIDRRIQLPLWLTHRVVESSLAEAKSSKPTAHHLAAGPVELLRLYLDFDLLMESLKLSNDWVNRVIAHLQTNQNALVEVALPYSLFDRLFKRLKDTLASEKSDTPYITSLKSLEARLVGSLNTVKDIRQRIEATARLPIQLDSN